MSREPCLLLISFPRGDPTITHLAHLRPPQDDLTPSDPSTMLTDAIPVEYISVLLSYMYVYSFNL